MTRHQLDWFSLVSGVVLTVTAVLALTGVTTDAGRWVGPAALIGIGVLVLAGALASSRDRAAADGSDDPADDGDEFIPDVDLGPESGTGSTRGSSTTSDDVRAAARDEVDAADRTTD